MFYMKNKKLLILLLVMYAISPGLLFSADNGFSNISVGARQHINHSEFVALPFNDGDVSVLVAYEYHEEMAAWQLALNYAPDVNGLDYVLTPQINLILKDGIWRGGLGIVKSYMAQDSGNDWTDLYWQFIAGIHLPFFGLGLDVDAYYVFEDWNKVDNFDFNDVELGSYVSFSF